MTPLVLVHGFMGGSDQWSLQRKAFESSRTVITVDLPGFGRNNSLTSPDSIAGFSDFVFSHLDQLNLSRFDLLGHSMGGMIVQEMVAKSPERINRLILYGTAATGNLPSRFETFETSKQRAAAEGVTATARRISATWFRQREAAENYHICSTIAERSSGQAVQAGLAAMEHWSRVNHLQKINCPTLIIWGEHDRTYGWEQIQQLRTAIQHVSLAVMPACSHAAHLEKSKLFNAILADFLDHS